MASSLTVDASQTLATLPAHWFGTNMTAPNLYSLDAAVPAGRPSTTSLLAAINASVFRFPGGPLAQRYDWRGANRAHNPSHPYLTASYSDFLDTDQVGGHGAAGLHADTLVAQAAGMGARCMMCVNYGTSLDNTAGGDPALAAAWVQHHKDNGTLATVPYWEIGAETYWRARTRGSDSVGITPNTWPDVGAGYQSATAYGTHAASFWRAMKAVEPTITCGLVAWTDGGARVGPGPTTHAGWTAPMLTAFKSASGGAIPDFLIIHYYPEQVGFENDTTVVACGADIAAIMGRLTAIARAVYGQAIPVYVTETNLNDGTPLSRQTANMVDALYAAHIPLLWIEQGAQMVLWWSDHCSTIYTDGRTTNFPAGTPLYGTNGYGTFGFLSSGVSRGGQTEPPVNTPYPTYYALRLVAQAGTSGDALVPVQRSDVQATQAHAWRRTDGKLAVLVGNRDSAQEQMVQLTLSGFTAAGTATDYRYDPTASGITSTPRSGLTGQDVVTLPPYGLLVRVYS